MNFKDSKNNTWEISLNFGSIKRLKDSELAIDLLDLEGGEPPLITRFATDIYLLVNTIYVLVKPQCDSQNVSDTQFGENLGGDVILAAQNAFYQELQDFFLKCGRPDRVKAIAAQKAMIEKSIELMDKKIAAIDPVAKVSEIFGEQSMS